MKVIASACLLGYNCRYDGKSCDIDAAIDFDEAIPVCPECDGGLLTPRAPCEIVGGDGRAVLEGKAKVISIDGEDCTSQFIRGAAAALRTAQQNGVTSAYLKSKSPSCGAGKIYDGTFTHTLREGNGVTAELLEKNGIKVFAVG